MIRSTSPKSKMPRNKLELEREKLKIILRNKNINNWKRIPWSFIRKNEHPKMLT